MPDRLTRAVDERRQRELSTVASDHGLVLLTEHPPTLRRIRAAES